jgi:hemerythrin-like domain-containing protein
MQEHDEALVQLSALNKSSRSLVEDGFSMGAFRRLQDAVAFVEEEVGFHNKREEEALFPVLERYVEGPTGLMRDEHRTLKKEFGRLRRSFDRLDRHRSSKAAAEEVAGVAKGIVQIMVNHIHKENHILFPLVQKFLTKDALREIARRLTAPASKI